MIRSLALLSDIHGVLPALDAVLAEPDVAAADRIVVTGDLAAGPQPIEVLDRLLGLGDRVVLVRGNADRELVEMVDGAATDDPGPDRAVGGRAARRRPDLVDTLRALPHPVTLEVAGFGPVLFCHGTPPTTRRSCSSTPARTAGPRRSPRCRTTVRTVVCGHTHMPFVRLVDRRMVVNPGSVGMPYGGTGAHWALLAAGGVTLRTHAFDVDGGLRRASRDRSGYPGRRRVGRRLPRLARLGPRRPRRVRPARRSVSQVRSRTSVSSASARLIDALM